VLFTPRATAATASPLGLGALAALLSACTLVVDVEDCRTDAVCGAGRVCVEGACLTVAPPHAEAGTSGVSPPDEDAALPGLDAPPLLEGCDESLMSGGALVHSRENSAGFVRSGLVQALEVNGPADLPHPYANDAVIDLTFEAWIRVADRGDYTFEATAAGAIQQSVGLNGQLIARGAPRATTTMRLEPGLHLLQWTLGSVSVDVIAARMAAGPAGQALRVLASPVILTPYQCDGVRSPCESKSDADVFGAGTCGP